MSRKFYFEVWMFGHWHRCGPVNEWAAQAAWLDLEYRVGRVCRVVPPNADGLIVKEAA